jgi:transposase
VKGSSTSSGLADWISSGVILDRSTLADWLGCATFLLRPGHERPLAVQKRSAKLFADGSAAPVLDPGWDRNEIGLCSLRP